MTLEQHVFELCWCTYMWIFPNKYSQPSVSMGFTSADSTNHWSKIVFSIFKLYFIVLCHFIQGAWASVDLDITGPKPIFSQVQRGWQQFLSWNSYHVWCSIFILLCKSILSFDSTSFLPEGCPLTFLLVQVYGWQILSVFLYLEKFLFHLYFWKIFSLGIEFYVGSSIFSVI